MGLPFRIVLYAPDDSRATNTAAAAFSRIRELNDILTDYDESSELSRLSWIAGTGERARVGRDLWIILKEARAFSRASEGAFDITVGPVVRLWRRARRQRQLPDPQRLQEALQATGHDKLELRRRDRSVRLLAPGMRLDAGGIAKGYAIDEALKVLKSLGIRRALVAGGGDMAAGDPPPGTKGWRIEIAPLDVPGAPPTRHVTLANAALATSGDLFQHVEIDGIRYSHIVDPRTGLGLTDHSLVTVIAPNCTTADALATAVSVLGPKKGLRLVESTRGVEATISRKPGDTIESFDSGGFSRFLKNDVPPGPGRAAIQE